MDRLKRQRSNRKGRIGQIQKALDTYAEKDVREQSLDELEDYLESISKVTEAYELIQEQITNLLLEDDDEAAATAEAAEAVTHEELYAHARLVARRLKKNLLLHQQIVQFEEDFEDWERVANPKSKQFLVDIDRFKTNLNELEVNLTRCACLTETVKAQRAGLKKIHHQLRERSYGSTYVEEKPSISCASSHSRLYVEPPSFDGDPLKWQTFRKLFEDTIRTRASHLDNTGRVCLLQKSLKDTKAYEIATHNSHGDDGFVQAMTALEEQYGAPIRLLPYLLKVIQPVHTFTYSYEGMASINRQFGLPYDSLRELKVDLSTYLAAEAATRFEPKLKEEWAKYTAEMKSLPTIDDLREYTRKISIRLGEEHGSSISNVAVGQSVKKNFKAKSSTNSSSFTSSNSSSTSHCIVCDGKVHSLSKCPKFMEQTPERRGRTITDHGWCKNCLFHSHSSKDCTSKHSCRHCGLRHHSLLHRGPIDKPVTTIKEEVPVYLSSHNPATLDSKPEHNTDIVEMKITNKISCLPTALVNLRNGSRCCTARLAFDTGAAVNFITEDLASRLKLSRTPQRLAYKGAVSEGTSKSFVEAILESRFDSEQKFSTELSVVPKLPTTQPPSQKQDILADPVTQSLSLADEDLGGQLDILIGSLDEFHCRIANQKRLPKLRVGLSETIFGWTVVSPSSAQQKATMLSIQPCPIPLEESLNRLWEMEKLPDHQSDMTMEDTSAMEQFADSVHILPTGRYQVVLPRPPNPPRLGDSRHVAMKRFQGNEKTMAKRGSLETFNTCLQEYLLLDHAEASPRSSDGQVNYLPVHGVTKDSSTTTKLRPVFDASVKTTTGTSFNDTLLTGPTLHPNLIDLLIRFRTHNLGMSADISKMFREISLDPGERDLHRFLLRDRDNNILTCRMKRLTFGVRPSPFLATRVLRHLAETHQHTHPEGAKAILNSFYVDDYLGGADTIERAIHIREQLCDLLNLACMKLRKWRSSDETFLKSIPSDLVETEPLQLKDLSDSPKTLGVHWDVQTDSLHLATPSANSTFPDKLTKRVVASVAAQVYDVLGLFAPYTVVAKMILQAIWKSGLSWDAAVSEEISSRWDKWKAELDLVHGHSISRRYTNSNSPVIHQSIHGFSDASEVAYGAAVYLRQEHQDGSISTALIFSKARVAPLKPLTIPRAELVGAHLLAKTINLICSILNIPLEKVTAWTDSTIVLCWIHKSPTSLKTFVAHRVNFIQETLPDVSWRHVPTLENPADLLSRGSTASSLLSSSLWWQGPDWLTTHPSQWPTNIYNTPINIPETRVPVLSVCTAPTSEDTYHLWIKYSCFHKLCRIVAWIKRFLYNSTHPGNGNKSANLSQQEVAKARTTLFKIIQEEYYPDVFLTLREKKGIPRGHIFFKYQLFIDDNQLLILTGRVRSAMSNEARQLIPLSVKSSITKLYLNTLHQDHHHPGTNTLMAIVAEIHHIPALKPFLKQLGRKCVICQRAYAQPIQPTMGMLPAVRTTPSTTFENTGVDFAGPFTLKKGHTRKPVLIKAYVCLFVCMATKAVHIELCGDLSTASFMEAITRFTSRRGTPSHFYSDNGTNFVGAATEIRKLQDLITTSEESLLKLPNTTWHHIPPRAPHFGGLWESGIRKMKILLRKHLAPHPLTTEELLTILTAIEATLNSQPLTACESTDPDNIALTPGHFLIGKPLRALPRKTASTDSIHHLRRWKLVQRLSQDLWTAWKGSYINSLQSRAKWQRTGKNLKLHDVVLVKDEVLQTATGWPIARVMQVYPGDDKQVRTVDVYCNGHTYKRAANRIIYLLSPDD